MRPALPLVWSMECGSAGRCIGFTDEAITFALALERHVDLRLEISETCAAATRLGLGLGLGFGSGSG